MASSGKEVTQLLRAWSGGDESALDQLIPLAYGELHLLARHYMAQERPGHTLQATALVNEAYLRLANDGPVDFQGRAHFFAISARAMRRILVDWASVQNAQKRGGDAPVLELPEDLALDQDGKQRDGRSAQRFGRNHSKGLELYEELAASRAEPGAPTWKLSAGGRSSSYTIRPWSKRRAGG